MDEPVSQGQFQILYDELKLLRQSVEKVNDSLVTHTANETEERVKVAENIAALNVKSGVWGLVGGILAALMMLIVEKGVTHEAKGGADSIPGQVHDRSALH